MTGDGACQGREADKRTRAIFVREEVVEAVALVQAGPPGRIDVQECVRMKYFEMKVEGVGWWSWSISRRSLARRRPGS